MKPSQVYTIILRNYLILLTFYTIFLKHLQKSYILRVMKKGVVYWKSSELGLVSTNYVILKTLLDISVSFLLHL